MTTDEMIWNLAELQHGAVGRIQLRHAGVPRRTITVREASGLLQARGQRVFVVAGAPWSPKQDLMVAVLDAGPRAAVSHEAAAALFGLPGFWPGPLDVSRQRRGPRGMPTIGELHEPCYLPDHHLTTIDGIPATNVARTVFDSAGTSMHPRRVERLLDNVVSLSPSALPLLHRMLFELAASGRPGITLMRDLLDGRPVGIYVPPASGLEARAIELLEAAGIKTIRQLDLGGEHWIGRVDLRVVGKLLIIECDSILHHFSKSDRERDERRDEELGELGLKVVRVSDIEVFQQPWVVGPKVHAALRELI